MRSPHETELTPFGKAFQREHFVFDQNYTPLNHGSYGAFPCQVCNYQRSLQDRIEARSDPFIRFNVLELLLQSRIAAVQLLGAPVDDLGARNKLPLVVLKHHPLQLTCAISELHFCIACNLYDNSLLHLYLSPTRTLQLSDQSLHAALGPSRPPSTFCRTAPLPGFFRPTKTTCVDISQGCRDGESQHYTKAEEAARPDERAQSRCI